VKLKTLFLGNKIVSASLPHKQEWPVKKMIFDIEVATRHNQLRRDLSPFPNPSKSSRKKWDSNLVFRFVCIFSQKLSKYKEGSSTCLITVKGKSY